MRVDRRRGPSALALFLSTGLFVVGLTYKGEYDSCVRNQAIRATYNDSFEVQRAFLATARDRNLTAADVSLSELQRGMRVKVLPTAGKSREDAAAVEAAATYQGLIDGQRSVRELDCGPPFPDNS